MTVFLNKLGSFLVEKGQLTEMQLQKGLEHAASNTQLIGESLTSLGYISEAELLSRLGELHNLEVIIPDQWPIFPANCENAQTLEKIIRMIPRDYAEAAQCVPFHAEGDLIFLANLIPWNCDLQSDIEALTGLKTKMFIAGRNWISQRIHQLWAMVLEQDPNSEKKLTPDMDMSAKLNHSFTGIDQISDRTKTRGYSVDEISPAEFRPETDLLITDETRGLLDLSTPPSSLAAEELNRIISEAIRSRASDIHLESGETGLHTRMRVDGVMLETGTEQSRTLQKALATRIKVLGNMDISETRMPQDGRFSIRTRGRETFDARVSTMPSAHGERVVLRLLPGECEIISLDQLGFPSEALVIFRNLLALPHGILLVTGPTGSGKTTTLYGALDSMDKNTRNIITLEDPIETRLKGISQIQVNPEIGFTFAAGLRSLLRQDPDVIMVGEIRDSPTAEIAVHASMTGHMVLSTLHTRDASGAVMRMSSMGTDRAALASSLNGVIAQRLVRKLCSCRTHSIPTEKDLVFLSSEAAELVRGQTLAAPVGCVKCRHTGYSGRTTLVEILPVDEDMRELMRLNGTEKEIRHHARKCSETSLEISGIRKVLMGETSLAELTRIIAEF
ncbi:MAG: hypothetical protein CVV64_09400 [Candidatus Wallbacteria bacterium HGW-Wallbacteria-1]|jgi:type II secretory ATPase GspE/PulE/Tfp pilus assembly ATPase PilB-like protein|uniref:Bacterial type II secretion system protein E domain-containing protein n=1 Tax=Candidatus Wallbacteria bacterium HGW-Wallbacteria-1 TaxID=2013854 RepID=A0A2N1PQE8_9BACT|nr:MAG: hypothetical protein CVV64_09400 [Candidatus Wallbacteria bacterium HGW-Wallbacteria-1]